MVKQIMEEIEKAEEKIHSMAKEKDEAIHGLEADHQQALEELKARYSNQLDEAGQELKASLQEDLDKQAQIGANISETQKNKFQNRYNKLKDRLIQQAVEEVIG